MSQWSFVLFLLSNSQYSVKLSVLSYCCCCFVILSLDHWRQWRASENRPRDWRTFECDCYKTSWHSWRNSVWRKARGQWRNGVIDTQNVLRIYNTLIDHKEDIKNMFLFFTSQFCCFFSFFIIMNFFGGEMNYSTSAFIKSAVIALTLT